MLQAPYAPYEGRAAHPRLRAHVRGGYSAWVCPADRTGRFVLPATSSVTLVLKVEDSAERPPQFLRGVDTGYTVIEGGCAPRYIEFALSPLRAYQVLGTPMDEVAGHLVDLADVVGRCGRRVGELIRDEPTWQQRFAVLDRFLLDRLADAPTVAPEVALAWRRLLASGGTTTIGKLCTETGWSHKHLINRFRNQVGVTPKQAARLLRFERVLRRAALDSMPDWALIAADCGYADQAHLTREFGRFTATTPAAHTRAREHSAARRPPCAGKPTSP